MTRFKTTLTVLTALIGAGSAAAAPLTVNLEGIEARGGTLYVGVQTEAQFMQHDGVAGEIIEAPVAGAMTFTFNLPEGAYSISVWHDLNANGQFDLTDAGPPAEGWGIFNAAALRGPPAFKDVSLALPAEGRAVSLSVAYPK